jgi:hypothetical protein
VTAVAPDDRERVSPAGQADDARRRAFELLNARTLLVVAECAANRGDMREAAAARRAIGD